MCRIGAVRSGLCVSQERSNGKGPTWIHTGFRAQLCRTCHILNLADSRATSFPIFLDSELHLFCNIDTDNGGLQFPSRQSAQRRCNDSMWASLSKQRKRQIIAECNLMSTLLVAVRFQLLSVFPRPPDCAQLLSKSLAIVSH